MGMTLKQIADLVGGTLIGDGNIKIETARGIEEARKGDITFLHNPKYIDKISTTKASAVVVGESVKIESIPHIKVKNPYWAYAQILKEMAPAIPKPAIGIDKMTRIGHDVRLGKNISIGPFVVLSDRCNVGDDVTIYPGCYIGNNVEIGVGTIIYPNVTIREGCKIGNSVIIHSGTVIGSDGYGYVQYEGRHEKIPQTGIVDIGDCVEIGANVTIDRATTGITHIGEGTKVDNLVQIAHNVKIGKNCLIIAQVGISGSTVVEDNVTLAGQAGIVGHISIGEGAVVGAQAGVTKSIPPRTIVSGYPARPHKETVKIEAQIRQLPKLIEEIKALKKKIEELEKKK